MRIDFKPYALIYSDDADIYDVYFIIIDDGDKTIDCCDQHGFSIAKIFYAKSEEIGYLKYDENERLSGDDDIIVKNGELVMT